MSNGLIRRVEPGSIAEEGGIQPGDCLLSVNGTKLKDIFDYRFLMADDFVLLRLRDQEGEEYELEIEKDTYEDIGIEFENPLMDSDRSCANKCIFCFVDQMPEGMRDTLYFKDDDTRLSFLTGNYVTLTNTSIKELKRIVAYRMSPINISVHTTDPELRKMMLGNKTAGNIMEKIKVLADGDIKINAQVVLCPGINDGEYLEETIDDLFEYHNAVESLSIVPVGISKYRDGLYPLRLFTPDEALDIIRFIQKKQIDIYHKIGRYFVYAADEFYVKAKLPVPNYEKYDTFPQLENGVGMAALLKQEVIEYTESDAFEQLIKAKGKKAFSVKMTIATGRAAYGIINGVVNIVKSALEEKAGKLLKEFDVEVVAIENNFFGNTVTVSGLVTGGDLIEQLKGKKLGSRLLFTHNMLRDGENVFLDDVTTEDVSNALGVDAIAVGDTGAEFVEAILG